MPINRTNQPFGEEVTRLLEERRLSVSELARRSGVSQSHLSRLLRQKDYKRTPSPKLARAVADALDLRADYFAEYREGLVFEKIRKSPRLRDRLYDDFFAGQRRRH